jgi:hypothetical protein
VTFGHTQVTGGEGWFPRVLCVLFASFAVKAFDPRIAGEVAEFAEKILPRVLVETPAPPALRKGALERRQLPGCFPPVCFLFNQLLVLGF